VWWWWWDRRGVREGEGRADEVCREGSIHSRRQQQQQTLRDGQAGNGSWQHGERTAEIWLWVCLGEGAGLMVCRKALLLLCAIPLFRHS
jgi:hypothetical protein